MTGRRLSLGILAGLGVLALGAWVWRAIGAGRGGAPAGPAIAIEAAIAEIEAGRRTTPLVGEPAAGGERVVTFLARQEGGQPPRIVSDVTGWGEHVDGTFDFSTGTMARVGQSDWYLLRAEVAPRARIEYLIAYGQADYRLDPHNPRRSAGPEAGGLAASELVMPDYVPPEELAGPRASPAGVVSEADIPGPCQVSVYRPAAAWSTGPYPLAVFLDSRSGQISRVLDWLIARRAIEPVVAAFVGPRSAGDGHCSGKAAHAFVAGPLLTWLASHADGASDRQRRAIVAISFGAKDALDIARTLRSDAHGGRLAMKVEPGSSDATAAFDALEQSVYAALENYSNVHRGSGHHSMVSTYLFEQARGIVLEHLGLSAGQHVVIFGTPRSADSLTAHLEPGSYLTASSRDVGLPLGVRALAVERRALPKGPPVLTGGGTARLVGADWVMWAAEPGRFEAGTPAIVNVIAFAKALLLRRHLGDHALESPAAVTRTAAEILRVDELDQYSGRALLQELRQTLIGRDARVPTVGGDRPFVNLDNGASTPTFEPIWAAFRQAWRQPVDVQQGLVQEARSIVAEFVGAPPSDYDVIFTANTTDAINLVAESTGRAGERGIQPVVINTLLEHNSNELPWRTVPGASLVRLPMNAEGFLDLAELEALLRAYNEGGLHGAERVTLVAVSGASNVLGVFNDLDGIARIVHRYGARLLVDAAQLIAHRTVSMAGSGIDYLAFSAHKAYAPFGTGVLVAEKGLLAFSPAEMERIRLAGEENVGGIAALGKALLLLQRIGMDVIQEEEQALTARALRGLAQIPGIKVPGIANPESASFAHKGGVIPFDLKGVISHTVGRRLAARGGIGVRSGCHCAHLTVKRMAAIPPWAEQFQRLILTVLRKFELPGVVRVSLGLENTESDIDALLTVMDGIARRPKAGPAEKAFRQRMDDVCKAAARRVYAQQTGVKIDRPGGVNAR